MVDGGFRERFEPLPTWFDQTLDPGEYELIWVEYGSSIAGPLRGLAEQYVNMTVLPLGHTGDYHSSFCFNAGIERTAGELIVIPDADVAVDPDFLQRVRDEHIRNEHLAMYIYRYDEAPQDFTGHWDLDHLRQVCTLVNPENYGGCLTVRRKWLLAINGYEQHDLFGTGFHTNGKDVAVRLKILGLDIKWHPELRLYHGWHPSTRVNAPIYQLQRIITEYRARTLAPVAFNGIDQQHDRPIPPELECRIRSASEGGSHNVRRRIIPQRLRRALSSLAHTTGVTNY